MYRALTWCGCRMFRRTLPCGNAMLCLHWRTACYLSSCRASSSTPSDLRRLARSPQITSLPNSILCIWRASMRLFLMRRLRYSGPAFRSKPTLKWLTSSRNSRYRSRLKCKCTRAPHQPPPMSLHINSLCYLLPAWLAHRNQLLV